MNIVRLLEIFDHVLGVFFGLYDTVVNLVSESPGIAFLIALIVIGVPLFLRIAEIDRAEMASRKTDD